MSDSGRDDARHWSGASQTTILRFEVPTPSSTKNSRQLFVKADGTPGSLPGKRGARSKAEVRARCLDAVREIVGRLRSAKPELLGADDDLGLNIEVDVAKGVARVAVRSLGPKPKGRTGRGKDLDNIASTIMDGMNRVAYGDDRQIAELTIRRVY